MASFLYRSLEIMCVEALPLTFCTIADIACCCMLLHVVACCCMLLHAPHSREKGQKDEMRKDMTVLCTQQGSKGEAGEGEGES